jgi:itaconyl-CoA hydratase
VTGDVTSSLPIGRKTRSMGRTITEGEFTLLNSLSWSISELHTNREAMVGTPFGERLLAGTILLAITEGLHDSSDALRDLQDEFGVQIGRVLGLTARFKAAVLPGDTLWADTELISAEPTDDAGVGVIAFRDVTVNQRDQAVVELERRYSYSRVAAE